MLPLYSSKRMFLHTHPYAPYLFETATRWIVGTLPPPRFSTGALKPGDVDFCYGSRDGQLWTILDRIYQLDLLFENSREAVRQRKEFLKTRRIGICDIVASAERKKIDASDSGMSGVQLRDLIGYLYQYPQVHTLLFTGGNSKNGPEYLFRRLLKHHGIAFHLRSDGSPRIHEFTLPEPATASNTSGAGARTLKTVSLIAPSGAANRAVGSLEAYKEIKKKYPKFTTLDFRVQQYAKYF